MISNATRVVLHSATSVLYTVLTVHSYHNDEVAGPLLATALELSSQLAMGFHFTEARRRFARSLQTNESSEGLALHEVDNERPLAMLVIAMFDKGYSIANSTLRM